MGLNPPFGVKASLANKFIDKALEFKPKLLILIVPKETERLAILGDCSLSLDSFVGSFIAMFFLPDWMRRNKHMI